MNLYTCAMCTLKNDHDTLPETEQTIGVLLHVVYPYKGMDNPVYVCKDCYKQVCNYIEDSRFYYEHCSNEAKRQAMEEYYGNTKCITPGSVKGQFDTGIHKFDKDNYCNLCGYYLDKDKRKKKVLEDHDCGTVQGQACQVCDGFGRDK